MCKQCEINPVYIFTNKRKICKNCFIKWFRKKVLYSMRKFSMAKKGDIISFKRNNNFRNVVLGDVINYYATRFPVEIVEFPKKSNKIALENTMDVEAENIIDNLANKKLKTKNLVVDGKFIKPLVLFLDKEVLLYAQLNHLKFIRPKKKYSFLDELEEKHPEVKRAIVNNFLD